MDNVVAFPDAEARKRLLRLRPTHQLSPYCLAELRFISSAEFMTRFCIGFVEGRRGSPHYPIRLALSAVDGFVVQTPKFVEAWAGEKKDPNMIRFLVAANRHACRLRTALERVRALPGLCSGHIKEIHQELEAVGTYIEGVLDKTINAFPTRA